MKAALSAAAVAAIVAGLLYADRVLDLFRLDGSDTVAEYMQASVQHRVNFDLRACDSGACLTEQQWACGFENGERADVQRCLAGIAQHAAPSVRLDTVRKFCGHRYARFTGERGQYANREECAKVGGMWGNRGPEPTLR